MTMQTVSVNKSTFMSDHLRWHATRLKD